jgi:NADH:ubiquinone oxidoreductase subunit 5 (subunit L)/multisubunit Na+/H+ antiporter MnhA subunit
MTIAGFGTILGGRLIALTERRVKKVVAFSTLSQIGLATITYGLGGFYVGYCNLLAHGLAKRLLFLQVGYFIHVRYRQQNTRL